MACRYNSGMQNYETDELDSRTAYLRLLQSACDELGVTVTWLDENWIAQLRKGDAHCLIKGYSFPLNNGVASGICRDKSATATVLHRANVATIPHSLLRFSSKRDISGATQRALALAPLPIVIKPNFGEGGVDVYKCVSEQQVAAAIQILASRYQSLAVAPFVTITYEYRVVMLDGQALLIFEKIRQAGQWQHNLALGATPQIVTDLALQTQLAGHANAALSAIGGRMGVVDIAATPDGLQVVEINGGVTLSHFSQHSAGYRQKAVAVYRAMVAASLGL